MRTISGDLIDNDYKISMPFRLLISGSSGTGKTTFIEKLLKSDRIDEEFSKIYYCYPYNLGDPPVDWHQTLSFDVEYLNKLPDLRFFDTVKPNSLLVLDDLWTETCKNKDLVAAFKVFSRKKKVSIIIVSQSYFSGGDEGREIRNNMLVCKSYHYKTIIHI